ncbi:MAG: ACP S-malonyltransferase [Saprospiraceae bacterium]|nr:ACP S-malonyltransferase [Saprospiraceae bacterium]
MAVLMFPGQGSQAPGMGKDTYESNPASREWFDSANEILGFDLTHIMFNGTDEDLKQTSVTQPAVFLNSFVQFAINKDAVAIDAVSGHSLGEFTALIANNTLSFEDGLKLVSQRAQAMQEACNNTNGTMAAILGLDDDVVESICAEANGTVVAANYNCPGQLVISGDVDAINHAVELATEKGARRAIVLNVNGAFHSPLMLSAKEALADAIGSTPFNAPSAPIYQNYTGVAEDDPEKIKQNLIEQLTGSVKWTQSMQKMVADGHTQFTEFGAKVLSGFIRRFDRALEVNQF